MRKLDQRGIAAFEFALVAAPLFVLMFAIFDLGRYAITMQSLRTLASAGARATMVGCYTDAAINKTTPTCSGDPLSDATKRNVAPFLFSRDGTLTPTLSMTTGASTVTVTASEPGFTMLTPIIWGTGAPFNHPSVSTKVPF